jgi:hypothetical protein
VDGVDVSSLSSTVSTLSGTVSTLSGNVSTLSTNLGNHTGASSSVHGVTGSVLGTNMTNTMGASGKIDCAANDAKLLLASRGNNSDPSGTDMENNEICGWWDSGGNGLWWRDNNGNYHKLS